MNARLLQNSPLTDEEIAEAVAAFQEHGTKAAAAVALGISVDAVKRRVHAAAERGLLGYEPVIEGFKVADVSTQEDGDGNLERRWIRQSKDTGEGPEFELPAGHLVKGVSALVDPNNHIVAQWIKTREDGNAVDWVEVFKSAFAEYEGRAEPIPPPFRTESDFINFVPLNDLHIRLLCWRREVEVNWDLKIAERVIGETIDTIIGRLRPADTGIILGGGDLMHSDSDANRTAKSGNILDADGRYVKGVEVAQRLKVRAIEAALGKHQNVIVRILKGNHDEQSAVAIAHFLSAWFRNEPRVTVDLDQSLFWYHQFGKVMLAATHGHAAKMRDMPGIMAHRRAEMWGSTKFRYCHTFHVHHRERVATEGNGVICESHQAPVPQDAWHFGEGYLAGRSIQAITYHKELGEFGRVIESILDVEDARMAA